MPLPRILVDDEKCHDPLSCRRCLLVCPTRVLGLGTSVGPEKFKQIDPGHFIVRGVRYQFCTGCLKCVEVCPTDAIQISFDGSEAA
jgi:NADH-quinone oxidoreductase subunit I